MKGKHTSLDRISALPQDTIGNILTLMPIRDALRTSILSKKWRYSWTRMPKLIWDTSVMESFGNKEIDKYKLVNAIFHVLLLHRGPILEFTLFVNTDIFSEIDQIIYHLSMSNNIKKFIFGNLANEPYSPPSSLFSWYGLEHLYLSGCEFELPLMNKGFSMLKTLHLHQVFIDYKMLQGLLTNCPLIEEFSWNKDNIEIERELTERELVELLKCLPSVRLLHISIFTIEHLTAGSMPHKLPISLPHLKILILTVCFLELSLVLRVMSNSPNLEKMELEMCWDHDELCTRQTSSNLLHDQDYTGLNLDHLDDVWIRSFHIHALEMEFVKLIMAKSPVLKNARIGLRAEVSVDEEIKMLRDLVHMPIPRASPAANLIIERD